MGCREVGIYLLHFSKFYPEFLRGGVDGGGGGGGEIHLNVWGERC